MSDSTAGRTALPEHPRPWRILNIGLTAHVIDALGDTVTVFDEADALWPFVVREINAAPDLLRVLEAAKDELERVAVDEDDFADTLAQIDAALSASRKGGA